MLIDDELCTFSNGDRLSLDEVIKVLSAGNTAATRGIVDYAKEGPLALMYPPVHAPFYDLGSPFSLLSSALRRR